MTLSKLKEKLENALDEANKGSYQYQINQIQLDIKGAYRRIVELESSKNNTKDFEAQFEENKNCLNCAHFIFWQGNVLDCKIDKKLDKVKHKICNEWEQL